MRLKKTQRLNVFKSQGPYNLQLRIMEKRKLAYETGGQAGSKYTKLIAGTYNCSLANIIYIYIYIYIKKEEGKPTGLSA